MSHIISNVKKSLFSMKFLIVFLIGFFLLFQQILSFYTTTDTNGISMTQSISNIEAFCMAIVFGSFKFLSPVISTIPSATGFSEEESSNYIYHVITRTNRSAYILEKILTTLIMGFLIIFLSLLVFGIFVSLTFRPINATNPEDLLPLEESIFADIYNDNGGILFILAQSAIGGLYGGLCGLIGLAVSLYIQNVYVTIASPFIIFYFVNLFNRRYLGLSISPYDLLLPMSMSSWLMYFISVTVLEGLFIFIVIHGFRRKYEQGI